MDLFCYQIHSIRIEIEKLEKLQKDPSLYDDKTFEEDKINMKKCYKDKDNEKCNNVKTGHILRKISELAIRMKIKALYWSQALVISQPESVIDRITLVTFANIAAQYSNQLASRADAILKQLQGKRRELLPSSVYLRDTSPTDFPNIHAWNRAAAPALIAEMVFHPFTAFSTEETVDRIRMIERLFADHYWTNINTVYASGQGEVRMALIKDDIGNWDLKSFDSDPSDLLDAYKKVTLAAMKAAADAAADSASGGAGGAALNLASQLARGRMGSEGPKAGQFDTSALHARVVARLENLERNVVERKESLDKESRDLIGEIEATKQDIEDGDKKIKTLETDIEKLVGEIAQLDSDLQEQPTDSDDTAAGAAEAKAATKEAKEKALEGKREDISAEREANAVRREWVKQDEIKLRFVEEKRTNFSKAVLSETREIIDNHEAVVDVLQESLNTQSQ